MNEEMNNGVTRVYIAGPMGGYEDFNRPMFNKVEKAILLNPEMITGPSTKRLEVINPVKLDAAFGLSESITEDNIHLWKPTLGRINELSVSLCDYIVMLPGWEDSEGARHEAAVAERYGLVSFIWPDDPSTTWANRVGSLNRFLALTRRGI